MFLVYNDPEHSSEDINKLLSDNNINHLEYPNLGIAHVDDIIMSTLEKCLAYEEIPLTRENALKIEKYFNDNISQEDSDKLLNKMAKAEADIYHIIYSTVNNKKDEILSTDITDLLEKYKDK